VGAPLAGVPTQHHAGARSLIRGVALASGFNSFELPANDDGSTAEIKLPFKVNYFGKTYGGVYVNNNGNLTFGASQSQYTPQPLGSITLPMIAPFWADVDTRVGNVVTYGSGTVEGHKAFGVNWPGVGCYAERDATTNTFQVLLISRSDIGTGDFDIEFNYGPIEWESGQASGGNESCLEGVPARAGYASGTGLAYELPGSGVANALLSSSPTTGLSNQSYGSTQPGTDVFTVRGGSPSPAASARYAALGDSYSAGEGDGSYTYGSGGAHNHCDRSPYAYGPLLADGVLSTPIAFVACSGAITDDFVAPNHEGNKNEVSKKLEPAQLEVLGPETETVTWTIGGNDVGFAELEKCFFARWSIIKVYGKSGCSKDATLVTNVHNRINALGGSGSATTPKGVPIQSMVSLLLEAHARAPQASIYVAGYPRLLGSFSGECGVGQFLVTNLPVIGSEYVAVKITSADAAWIDSVVEELNTTLEDAVSTAQVLTGVSITFVDPNPEFETHRLCDSSNTWIHEVEGEYNYSTKKATYVFPGSFHPTPEGQEQGYESAFLSAGL
jgi:hypothetical protein